MIWKEALKEISLELQQACEEAINFLEKAPLSEEKNIRQMQRVRSC